MPLVYTRNRCAGAVASALEWFARGSPRASGLKSVVWSTSSLPARRAVQHPELSGLWLIRQAVDEEGVAQLRRLVDEVALPPRIGSAHSLLAAADREVAMLQRQQDLHPSGSEQHTDLGLALGSALADRRAVRERAGPSPPPPPLRGRTRWEWYPYEPARLMAPMLLHPEDGVAPTSAHGRLEGFEVFDRAPVRDWLGLSELSQQGSDDARRLRLLTRELSHALAAAGGDAGGSGHGSVASPLQSLQAVFLQLQLLRRGAGVSAHVDAADPPADVVATVSLGSGSGDTVRVGHVVVPLEPGDCYAIGGHARWEVDHEVHPSYQDRLSLTFRFLGAANRVHG